MLTSISNNIGIGQVSFQSYESEDLTVLNAKFDVDPANAAWIAADEIVFEFASLVMNKSAISQVYMKNCDPGEQYVKGFRGTVLKSWIKGNKLHIEKISYFDAYGPLTFFVCSAYTTGKQRGQLVKDNYVTTGITNQPTKCTLDKKCLRVTDDYVFGLYTFKKFYPNTDELTQQFDITGMPTDVDVYLPVVYADPYNDKRGAVISEARIQNGHFSTTIPDCSTYYANSGTFIMFFAVRGTTNSSTETDNNDD